jgi:hypothetical protein
MRIVIPRKPIHKSEILNNELVITIPVKKNWFEILWLLFCFIICTILLYYFGKTVITLLLISAGFWGNVSSVEFGDMTYTPNTLRVLLIPMTILIATEMAITYSLLWRFVGKETVSANKDLLVITRKILGWKPYKAYKTSNISALRISHPIEKWASMLAVFQKTLGLAGTIVFDYGAKSYQFGDGLDEAEARQIIKKLQSHLSVFFPQFELDSKSIGE